MKRRAHARRLGLGAAAAGPSHAGLRGRIEAAGPLACRPGSASVAAEWAGAPARRGDLLACSADQPDGVPMTVLGAGPTSSPRRRHSRRGVCACWPAASAASSGGPGGICRRRGR
jgi:hypothetical protein